MSEEKRGDEERQEEKMRGERREERWAEKRR